MAAKRSSKRSSKSGPKTLTDVARKIGTTLGEVKARSEKVVRGLKAAAEASSNAYTGDGKANKRPGSAAKKKSRPGAAKKRRK